ncbi:MAG: hypothetical protein GY820_30490 [Gammaproteobacteria bacterium]|nr:hypothetical protein [Gammaproteobacteria bacterium]
MQHFLGKAKHALSSKLAYKACGTKYRRQPFINGVKTHKNIGLFGNAAKREKFDRNERKFQKHHGKL